MTISADLERMKEVAERVAEGARGKWRTTDSGLPQHWADFIATFDPPTVLSLLARVAELEGALREARHQLFRLCEHTEEECDRELSKRGKHDVLQPAYFRGRKHEAKGISRAMDEVFRDLIARSALIGEE